jgi:hypothetical protein
MTEREQQLISGLAERIRNAPAPQIDRDADNLIRQTIGTRPDALYILTQTVLLQEMALNQTKAQLEELRRQAALAPQGGFLHSAPSEYQAPPYQTAPAPPPPPPAYSGGGLSGFLHNAATTAAGVLAGEVAFESLSSLFGHRGGGFFGGGGGFFGSPSGLVPGSETIVNNYYNDNDTGGGDSRFGDAAAASGDQMSSDIQDERDNSGDAFAGDSSYDDGSSFDSGDSGSSDV